MAERVPGIIVRRVNDTGIVAPPLFERYPVIIGEGDPYRLVSNLRLTRGAGTTDAIPTVTTVNEIVSVGDLPGIAGYVAGTDYSLVGDTISWVGGTAPTAGDYYYLTFTETRPASAYTPMLYLDENLIYTDHGNRTRTDGSINDASVGGSLSINAAAGGVIIAQLNLSAAIDPDTQTNTEIENAIRLKRSLITSYSWFLCHREH